VGVTLVALGVACLVAWPIGGWVLGDMDRDTLRALLPFVVIGLALVPFAAGSLVFVAGRALLARRGVRFARRGPEPPPPEPLPRVEDLVRRDD
jgi:hypothetical protein